MLQEYVTQEQYLLRVARGSEIEHLLRLAERGDGATFDELEEAMGNKNAQYWHNRLNRWFDNLGIRKDDAKLYGSYTSVLPSQVQVVTSDVNFQGNVDGAATSSQPVELESKMRWPIAPPLIEKMDNFDKPKWYDRMKVGVKMGKHISLEGPPGVGKDTAVEQLAAELGKPLVTIGGDSGFRQRDLTGGQQLVNGTSFYDIGEYVAAAVNGWWVLLTEVNAADPGALMYINRQLAAPYIVNIGGKSYPVHKDFRLFVSYNHGLVGTRPLPQSFKDRFFPIRVPFFTKAQLRRRLAAMGWSERPEHERGNSIIVDFGIAMWDAHERGRMRYQITTRRLKDSIDYMVIADVPAHEALEAAVVESIDNPVEAKAASNVISQVTLGD